MDVEQQQEQTPPEINMQQEDATTNEEGRHPLQDSWTLWYLCRD